MTELPKNILLIDSTIPSIDKFIDGINSNTSHIVYKSDDTLETIKLRIEELNIKAFDNLGFIFTGDVPHFKEFVSNTSFISTDASENIISNTITQFIKEITHLYSIKNLDFLGCKLLTYPLWKAYFDYLMQENEGLIVRASDDLTGNLNVGGDWVLESTFEDVTNLYFKEEIGEWNYLLDQGYHSALISNDGKLWTCGYNNMWQLGRKSYDNSGISRFEEIIDEYGNIINMIANGGVKSISMTNGSIMVVCNDGTVWGRGLNTYGEIGDGIAGQKTMFVQARKSSSNGDFFTNAIKVSCGYQHSIILCNDGTVWASGINSDGTLGDGTNTSRNVFVQARHSSASGSFITDAIDISAGYWHSLILRANKEAWACGQNYYGQLGTNSYTYTNFFVKMINVSNISQISAGMAHSLVISSGLVYVCGINNRGQLGLNLNSGTYVPVLTYLTGDGILGGIKKAVCGLEHTVILRSDGEIWACGKNNYGQLGYSTDTSDKNVLVKSQSPPGVTDIFFTLPYAECNYIAYNNEIYVCGRDVNTNYFVYTKSYKPPFGVPTHMCVAGPTTVVVDSNDILYIRGYNNFVLSSLSQFVFNPVLHMDNIVMVANGTNYTMVLLKNGTVWACGYNQKGQLGNGTNSNKRNFIQCKTATGYLTNVVAIAAGSYYSAALLSNGEVWSCGENIYGQLGDGTLLNKNIFVQATIEDGTALTDVKLISCSDEHVMVIRGNENHVWTCGRNTHGQLGIGTTLAGAGRFVQAKHSSSNVVKNALAIYGGGWSSAIVLQDGTVWTCGLNVYGNLGIGNTSDMTYFVQAKQDNISTNLTNVKEISGGNLHFIALKGDGTVWSTGLDDYGVLGNGNLGNTTVFTQCRETSTKFLTGVKTIIGQRMHNLAIKTDGTLWGCGYNADGQFGNGSIISKQYFEKLPGLPPNKIPKYVKKSIQNPPASGFTGLNLNNRYAFFPDMLNNTLLASDATNTSASFNDLNMLNKKVIKLEPENTTFSDYISFDVSTLTNANNSSVYFKSNADSYPVKLSTTDTMDAPTTITESGLVAWFDASSFSNSQWMDKSQYKRHSTSIEGTPVKNGNAITFNGTTRIKTDILVQNGTLDGWTIFIVGKIVGNTPSYLYQTSPSNTLTFISNYVSNSIEMFGNGGARITLGQHNNQPFIIAYRVNADYTRSIYFNGILVRTDIVNVSSDFYYMRISHISGSEAGDMLTGDINDFIVYNRPLSDKEVTDVHAYLENKYTGISTANSRKYGAYYQIKDDTTITIHTKHFSEVAIGSFITSPNAPDNVSTSNIQLTSLDLAWAEPANGGADISSYTIYQSSDDTNYTQVANISRASLGNSPPTAHVENLLPNTQYYFKISATNSMGEGVQSNALQVTTENIVPDVPVSFYSSSSDSNSISLVWNPPVVNGGSNVTSYTIYKSLTNHQGSFSAIPGITTTSYQITGLIPNTLYFFSVSASNIKGEGLPTSTINYKTRDIAPVAPINLSGSINDSTLTLTWTAPDLLNGSSPVRLYRVYSSLTSDGSYTLLSTTSSTTIVLNNIKANTDYYYKVSAINNSTMESVLSSPIAKTIIFNAPSSPTSLSPVEIESNKVTLTWSIPSDTNANITSYNIYDATVENVNTLIKSVSGDYIVATLTNLESRKTYTYKISAVNNAGESPLSEPFAVTTNDRYPYAPLNTKVTDISTNSISISWNAPINKGESAIISYKLYVASNGGEFTFVGSTTSEIYTFDNLDEGTLYTFRINAENIIGEGDGAFLYNIRTRDVSSDTTINNILDKIIGYNNSQENEEKRIAIGTNSKLLTDIVTNTAKINIVEPTISIQSIVPIANIVDSVVQKEIKTDIIKEIFAERTDIKSFVTTVGDLMLPVTNTLNVSEQQSVVVLNSGLVTTTAPENIYDITPIIKDKQSVVHIPVVNNNETITFKYGGETITFTKNAESKYELNGETYVDGDIVEIGNIRLVFGTVTVGAITTQFINNKLILDANGNVIYLHKDITGNPINPLYDTSGNQILFPEGKLKNLNNSTAQSISNVQRIYSTFDGVVKRYAVMMPGGRVETWTDISPEITTSVSSGAKAIYATSGAFVALKNDGSVIAWGNTMYGGTTPDASVNNNIKAIYSTSRAFAALKNDGSVIAWGDTTYGGITPDESINTNITAIYSTSRAFVALKNDGSVTAWGDTAYGGTAPTTPGNLVDVESIYTTQDKFAAVKRDGTIVIWGGNETIETSITNPDTIFATETEFYALMPDATTISSYLTKYGNRIDANTRRNQKKIIRNLDLVSRKETINGALLTNLISVIPENYNISNKSCLVVAPSTNGTKDITLDSTDIEAINGTNKIPMYAMVDDEETNIKLKLQIASEEYKEFTLDSSSNGIIYNGSTFGIDDTIKLKDESNTNIMNLKIVGLGSWIVEGTALDAPTDISGTNITTNSATIGWTAIDGINTYNILVDSNVVYTTNATQYTLSDLSPNTAYNIVVQSVNATGQTSLIKDGTIEIHTLPEKPTNMTFTNIKPTSLTVSWVGIETITEYKLNVYTNESRTEQWNTSIIVNNTETTITRLTPDTQYYFSVVSVVSDVKTENNQNYESAPLNGYSRTLSSVPTNIKFTNVEPTSLTVSWTGIYSVISYKLYVYSDAQRTNLIDATLYPVDINGVTTYNITNLEDEVVYYVSIKSVIDGVLGEPLNGEIITASYGIPVSINFNILIDASSNIDVFGEGVQIPVNVARPQIFLPLDVLYDISGESLQGTSSMPNSIFEFWEPSDNLGIFKGQLAVSDSRDYTKMVSKFIMELQRVLDNEFDCSGVYPFNKEIYKGAYNMQSNFGRLALSVYADKLFGHVDATAAITNDVQFINSMLSKNSQTNNYKYATVNDVPDTSNILTATNSLSDANIAVMIVKQIITKNEEAVTKIVRQVIGQDASRAMNYDNNELSSSKKQPLKFISGDTIYVNIILRTPEVVVGNGQNVDAETLKSKYDAEGISYSLEIKLRNPVEHVINPDATKDFKYR